MPDGMTKVILSSTGNPVDAPKPLHPDIAAFLDFMNGNLPENDFAREVDDAIQQAKENEAEEMDYMTYQMKMDEVHEDGIAIGRKEGRKEGRREGRKEERENTIANMLIEQFPLSAIIKVCDTTMDVIREVAKKRGLAIGD